MQACSNCLEKKWSYKFIDGWIKAECQVCGNEIEFKAKGKVKKEHFAGESCRRCGTPIIFVDRRDQKPKLKQLKKAYYFTAYFRCTKCKTFYFDERFKVVNANF